MKTFHFIVSGRVQGVFFRYHTKETADRLSIRGTVRNLPTGEVEVFARGEAGMLERFEHFLHQGSPSSRVDKVTRETVDSRENFLDFRIL
jgi:acylphosphatase